MNTRTEIKIAIVGNESVGKEMFSKMLFLENPSKIKVDPLSKIAEMFLEIDTLNFQKSSKKIIDACKQQNNIILQQTKIISVSDLRKNNISPLFYRHTNRIKDFAIQTKEAKGPCLNKNILLTFYVIGRNYEEFITEIKNSNILIYLTDYSNKDFDKETDLFKLLVKIVKESSDKKYLLTIVNKCDTLNTEGEIDMSDKNYQKIINLDRLIRERANSASIHQNLLPPIVLSSKYSYIYRQIIYSGLQEIDITEKTFISEAFNVKKEHVIKDIQKNPTKYLKRCGFTNFRDILSDILNTNYRAMVDANFDAELKELETLMTVETKFIEKLSIAQTRSNRLARIFKKDYQNKINDKIKIFLNRILELQNPDLDVLDTLQETYIGSQAAGYIEIEDMLTKVRTQVNAKIITSLTNSLYNSPITEETFLPSKVHILLDKLLNVQLSKIELNQLVMHICELYGCKARNLLINARDWKMVYKSFFFYDESTKMMSMLNEIMPILHFDIYQMYLVQIMLTKLIVAEKSISNKLFTTSNVKAEDDLITYCQSLKYHLSNNSCKKYSHLFNNISDICTSIIRRLGGIAQLTHISENLDKYIDFKPDKIINLDKFIVKTIKKNSYRAHIAEDEADSGEDSDVDIYGDGYQYSDFEFTKDGMSSDNDTDSEANNSAKNKSNKKSGSNKKRIVDV